MALIIVPSESYSNLSQKQVDNLIDKGMNNLPSNSGLGLYEIGLGPKSARAFKFLSDVEILADYMGTDINQARVDELTAMGLKAKLVTLDHDHTPAFRELKKVFGDLAVVAMLGLPEFASEAAKTYWKQAKDNGLYVLSYPEIREE